MANNYYELDFSICEGEYDGFNGLPNAFQRGGASGKFPALYNRAYKRAFNKRSREEHELFLKRSCNLLKK